MTVALWRLLPICALCVGATQAAAAVDTRVDTLTLTVQIDFTELPPYEQIRLEGVMGLFWCNCLDPDNPSSMLGTGFTVNADALEMQYEGPPAPTTNFILYSYLDGYELVGFELVDWIVVTQSNGEQLTLTAERPIFVPEPCVSTGLLCALGLLVISRRRSRR